MCNVLVDFTLAHAIVIGLSHCLPVITTNLSTSSSLKNEISNR